MKLQEYLKKEKHTQQSFIDLVEMAKGVKIPQSTFAKWVLDIRIPRKKEMLILYDITERQVQPNDFYGISRND